MAVSFVVVRLWQTNDCIVDNGLKHVNTPQSVLLQVSDKLFDGLNFRGLQIALAHQI